MDLEKEYLNDEEEIEDYIENFDQWYEWFKGDFINSGINLKSVFDKYSEYTGYTGYKGDYSNNIFSQKLRKVIEDFHLGEHIEYFKEKDKIFRNINSVKKRLMCWHFWWHVALQGIKKGKNIYVNI